MKVFIITVYKHSFFIKSNSGRNFQLLLRYVDQNLTQYTKHFDKRRNKLITTLKCRYCHLDNLTNTVGLHINSLNGLLDYLRLNYIDITQIEYIYKNNSYETKPSNLILSNCFSLRDHQPLIIDFVYEDKPTRVVALQTGKGKTICSLYSIYKHRVRGGIVVANAFLKSWVNDASKIFTNSEDEVVVIHSSKAFMKLISLAKDDKLDVSVIIITQRCMSDYLKDYRESVSKVSSYGCNPMELYKLLGIGLRVIDECHRDLMFHYYHDIFTSSNKTIYNSATLSSNDNFVNQMYEIIYPIKDRYHGLAWDKYIDMIVVSYYLTTPDKAMFLNKLGMYNHGVYEMWLLKDTKRYLQYFHLIDKILKTSYLNINFDNKKALVFFQSVELCNIYSTYLNEKLKDLNLIINSFTSDDDDDNFFKSDIVISTIGSSGTGKDLPGLILALNTVALDTKQGNIQCLGRLRKIMDESKTNELLTPRYYQLVCMNISKHLIYHRRRMINLDDKIKDVKLISSEMYI